jgi:hypothetical protein
MMFRFFERPNVKQVGIVAFFFLLGCALGNSHETTEAMAGQAQWLHSWCGQQVKQTIITHEKSDIQAFGYTPDAHPIVKAPSTN